MLPVYTYLIATPFDQYSLFGLSTTLNFSIADLMAISMLIGCILRPRILFAVPLWYALGVFGVLIGATIGTSLSDSYQSLLQLRATAGKIVASYLVTAYIFEYKQLSKAIWVFGIGIFASIGLGIIQEIVWVIGGRNWTLLLLFTPPNSIIAFSKVFGDMLLRVPGGTIHPIILGQLSAFIFGMFIIKIFLKKGKLTYNILAIGFCILGIFIAESRAALVGMFSSLLIVFFAYSRGKRNAMVLSGILCMVLAPIFIASFLFFSQYGAGDRMKAFGEITTFSSKFFLGMGVGRFLDLNPSSISLHSTPLQILSDAGLLAIISYLLLLLMIFIRLWKRRNKSSFFFEMLCGGTAYLVPALFFHPCFPMRDHWVILGLLTVASCGSMSWVIRQDSPNAQSTDLSLKNCDVVLHNGKI